LSVFVATPVPRTWLRNLLAAAVLTDVIMALPASFDLARGAPFALAFLPEACDALSLADALGVNAPNWKAAACDFRRTAALRLRPPAPAGAAAGRRFPMSAVRPLGRLMCWTALNAIHAIRLSSRSDMRLWRGRMTAGPLR
jgi:hypothetical protein